MFLVPILSKQPKQYEDLAQIEQYISQMEQFQAPHEILQDLCRQMGYQYVPQNTQVRFTNLAYFILRGQILAENGVLYNMDQWCDSEVNFYSLVDCHCITLPLRVYLEYKVTYGESYVYKRKALLSQIPALDRINSSKLQEHLIRSFDEFHLGIHNYISRQDEIGDLFFILIQGKVQVSKIYYKHLSLQEKQVVPRKYWTNEIQICEMNEQGMIGEELLTQDKASYNVKVISKQALLLKITVQQLKTFPQIIINSLTSIYKKKHYQRDDIYKRKAQEIEKIWKATDKQAIMNSEIKRTISFKSCYINQESATQDQQIQTSDERHEIRSKKSSPNKKQPNFMLQYFRQKGKEPNPRKSNEISLQQFIQKQGTCNNPYSLFEKVADPLDYITKSQNYKRQQFSLFIQQGIVKIKQPDIPRQPKRPYTTGNKQSDLDESRQLILSLHTSKPAIKQLKKFCRSQSAHKNLCEGFSLAGKSMNNNNKNLMNCVPKEKHFFLRSGSSGFLMNRSHQSQSRIALTGYSVKRGEETLLG